MKKKTLENPLFQLGVLLKFNFQDFHNVLKMLNNSYQ